MNKKVKNVLLKLEESGYQAFIVGGYVRDYLMGIESTDIDISTDAEPKEIIELFNLPMQTNNNYGGIHIKDSKYNFDITTFRIDDKYENRRPTKVEFTDNIEEDVKRRDFTINALYMDSNENIYDLSTSKEDIKNHIIKSIGDVNTKLVEDPLRILRAIRFATILDFDIDDKLILGIKQNKNLLSTLSYERRKEELDLIFASPNKIKGINLIQKLKISEILEIEFEDEIISTSSSLGIWAQIDYSDKYPFSKNDKDTINTIKKAVKYSKIDNVMLYSYGLYVCQIAGEILKIDSSYISELYKNLPIYTSKDINISTEEILDILNIEPSSIIKKIYNDLEINILENNLNNDNNEIKEYIIKNYK